MPPHADPAELRLALLALAAGASARPATRDACRSLFDTAEAILREADADALEPLGERVTPVGRLRAGAALASICNACGACPRLALRAITAPAPRPIETPRPADSAGEPNPAQ